MSLNGKQARRKMGFWSALILAGVAAYGMGLYQGSQFRMQRSIASTQKPLPVDIAKQANAGLNPQVPGSSLPSNSPGNIQNLKSRSK